ncbi:AMP-binding protein [Streptosporangium canum]|uniref:AMP-binding protein n=1 Tax=Streptosporangium canum TaxID=324952 RepID=UPI0036C01272
MSKAAIRNPEAPALIGERVVTYGELMRSVLTAAKRLAIVGVAPGDVIGVASGRSDRAPIIALAIMRAGAVYLPLDPLYPDPLLAHMIESASATTVIVDTGSGGRIPAEAQTVLDADALLARAPTRRQLPELTPCGAAYAMFTSGSTGMPKGVLLGQAGLAQYAQALPARVGLREDDRCLGMAPLGFSSSIRQLLLPLTRGASVIVPGEEQIRLPWGLTDLIREHQVTHLDLTPSYWRAVLDGMPDDEVGEALVSLRRLLFASEPLDAELAHRTRNLAPHARVWNMYGCTETTGIVAAYEVTGAEAPDAAIPIGTALEHVSIDVQQRPHASDAPMAPGGEMVVTGSAVAMGYLEGAGAPAWRPDDGGGCAIRGCVTGDQVVAVGRDLVWNGRTDRVLKVRGMRVSPETVEHRLVTYPGIRRAAVVTATERGVVCVVEHAARTPPPDHCQVIAWLRFLLPSHMVPATITAISAWPVLPNGKTDYQKLIARYGSHAAAPHTLQ